MAKKTEAAESETATAVADTPAEEPVVHKKAASNAPEGFVKVRIKVAMAGPSRAHSPGDVVSVDPDEARRFIEVGYAEPV